MILNLLDEAVKLLREGLKIIDRLVDPKEKTTKLRLVADGFESLGLREEAREVLLEAARTALTIEDTEDMVGEIRNISRELIYCGYPEDALQVLLDAIKNIDRMEDVEARLYAYTQIVEELIDLKAVENARELTYQMIELISALEDIEIIDPDTLIDAFKQAAMFINGNELKELFSKVLYKVDEVEDDEIHDDLLLDLVDIALKLGWIDEAKNIVLNMMRSYSSRISGILKFSEFAVSRFEKVSHTVYEYEEE